jgi:hypothetical protein
MDAAERRSIQGDAAVEFAARGAAMADHCLSEDAAAGQVTMDRHWQEGATSIRLKKAPMISDFQVLSYCIVEISG